MASSELSVMLTAKGNLETELRGARDRVKDLSTEIRKIQASGGTVGEDLADEFRQATIAADKLSNKLNEVNRKVKETARESTTAAAKVSKAWSKAASVFNNDLVAGLSVASLVYFGKKAVDTFANVQDSASALSATFGANGDALIKWAKASGDALNLSQAEALAATQTFAGFASAAGLTGRELETFATDLTARAADLASYYGGTTADAVQALGAALRGEAEPARRYMIMLDDMALKAEYFDLTGQKVTGTLTAQQKILAAQSLIMRKSSQAQGDITRTADSMANQIKDSQQQMADFQATAGETIAIVLNPMLKIVNGLAKGFASLPDPVKQVAVAVGLIGTAALIATPRIVAMKTALTNMGGAGLAVGKGGLKAAAGIAAVTVAMSALRSQADSNGNVFTSEDAFANRTYGEALREIVQPGWFGSIQNGLAGITDALVPHNTYLDDARSKMASFDTELVNLVAQGKQADAKRMFDDLVSGASAWGATADDVKDILPGYTSAVDAAAKASKDAGGAIGGMSDDVDDLADSLTPAQRALEGLAGAMGIVDRAMRRRSAQKAYDQAMKDFVKKPSEETASGAMAAANALADTFDNPAKKAKILERVYPEITAAIEKSGMSDKLQEQLITPLDQALAKINSVNAALAQVNYTGGTPTAGYTPAPVRRAAGGAVWGPGTATSDSIPALLSNGEYVLRASAVRTIGLGTLNKLNHADKMTDPALLDRMAVGNTPSTPAGDPLIGSIVVNNPSRDVDVEKAVLRGMARAERIRKERG